jgi:NADH-quinone oxidoreductase subunit L
VLAFSTVSQLGYMFIACGVGAFSAAIFHLLTHAFFKGLLFLAAGSVIHAVSGEQDMRLMGGLRTKIPWTFWTMTVGTFAIAGIPPLAGFFSKDEILWRAYQSNRVYWLIGLFTAFLTSFYMFRLWFLTFFGEYRGVEGNSHDDHSRAGVPALHGHGDIHESPRVMVIPLVVLAVLSVTGGWIGVPGSLGGSNRFEKFLGPVFHSTPPALNSEHGAAGEVTPPEIPTEGPEPQASATTELAFTAISVFAALLGFGLAWLLYYRNPKLPQRIASSLGGFYRAVLNKYYVDEVYATLLVKPLIAGSTLILWRGIDQDVIDAALDNGAHGAREVSDSVRHMQSGNLRSYAGWVAAGAALVIAYMVWMGTR